MIREDLTVKVTSKKRSVEGEGHEDVQENVPGRNNDHSRGSYVGPCLECLQNSKEVGGLAIPCVLLPILLVHLLI